MYHFKTRGMYWFVVGLYTTCHLLPDPENYSEYIMNQRTCENMACKIPGVTCSLQVTHHSKNACSFWMMINPYYIKCWFGNQSDKKHTGLGLPGVLQHLQNRGSIPSSFGCAGHCCFAKGRRGGHCPPLSLSKLAVPPKGVFLLIFHIGPKQLPFCLNLLLDRLSMFFLYEREFSFKTCQNSEAFDGF